MPQKKRKVTLNIDPDVWQAFYIHCFTEARKQGTVSSKIEELMIKFLSEKGIQVTRITD